MACGKWWLNERPAPTLRSALQLICLWISAPIEISLPTSVESVAERPFCRRSAVTSVPANEWEITFDAPYENEL